MLNRVKIELIDRLDPDYYYFKHAIRTTCAVVISLLIYHYKQNLTQGYWLVLASAFLMQTRLGDTQDEQIFSILLCTIVSGLFAWIAGFFWHDTLTLATFLAITTCITVYLNVFGINIAISALFVNLFAIMSSGLPTDLYGLNERFLMILLGGCIDLFICLLFPPKILKSWHRWVKIYYSALAEFSSLLHGKKDEERLHERRNRLMRFLNVLRKHYFLIEAKLLDTNLSPYNETLKHAEQAYAALISLGNIRHRINTSNMDALLFENIHQVYLKITFLLNNFANTNLISSNDEFIARQQINILKKSLDELPSGLKSALTTFVHSAENLLELLKHDSQKN